MEALNCIKNRRSIRRYQDKLVDNKTIEKVISTAAFAPSWKNSQTTRYIAVTDKTLKEKIAKEGMMGFEYNIKTALNAPVIIVVTTVNCRSGYERDGSFTTSKGTHWQSFDAGIATQTLCLSAFEEGLGTVIMGIFDEQKVAEILKVPEGQSVSALVALGYADEESEAPKRKAVEDLLIIK